MDHGGVALLKRAIVAALIFSAGIAVGSALTTGRTPPPDRQIRAGRTGFTNPLLDCEIGGYPRGRELTPFKRELSELVAKLIAQGEAADVAVYFRDLDNGPWFGIGERESFTPGSLIKVPLLMACLLQAESDPSFLDKQILFQGLPDEGGISAFAAEKPLVVGRTYTVEQLVEQVAIYSDNYATWLLYTLVDLKLLERVHRDLGLDPELVRNIGKPATVSPKTYGQLFRVLYNASYLDRPKSEKLLAAMSRAAYRGGLVAGVAPGTPVAHKFGVKTASSPGARHVQMHDCGIVYHPRRPYFLCVMTRGADQALLEGVIAQTSRFVAEKIEQHGAAHPVAAFD